MSQRFRVESLDQEKSEGTTPPEASDGKREGAGLGRSPWQRIMQVINADPETSAYLKCLGCCTSTYQKLPALCHAAANPKERKSLRK